MDAWDCLDSSAGFCESSSNAASDHREFLLWRLPARSSLAVNLFQRWWLGGRILSIHQRISSCHISLSEDSAPHLSGENGLWSHWQKFLLKWRRKIHLSFFKRRPQWWQSKFCPLYSEEEHFYFTSSWIKMCQFSVKYGVLSGSGWPHSAIWKETSAKNIPIVQRQVENCEKLKSSDVSGQSFS